VCYIQYVSLSEQTLLLQNQPEKALAELTEAREANAFNCSPSNCDEIIHSFIR
jgi:hypothetical protein